MNPARELKKIANALEKKATISEEQVLKIIDAVKVLKSLADKLSWDTTAAFSDIREDIDNAGRLAFAISYYLDTGTDPKEIAQRLLNDIETFE